MLAGSEHFNEIKDEAVRLLKNIDTMELGDLVEAVKRISAYKIEITDYLDILMIWYRDVLIDNNEPGRKHKIMRYEGVITEKDKKVFAAK